MMKRMSIARTHGRGQRMDDETSRERSAFTILQIILASASHFSRSRPSPQDTPREEDDSRKENRENDNLLFASRSYSSL